MDPITGSTILSTKSLKSLYNLIGIPNNATMTLLYQGSRDGFNVSALHSKVDGINGTLTVIQTPNLNIFGGYTGADWSGNWGSKYDSTAFLFSLVNNYSIPVKMNVINPYYAIYASFYYGPVFGSGYDLYTLLYYYNSKYGYSNFGYNYEYPYFIKTQAEAQSFLAGSYTFNFDELEVYSLSIDGK